MLQYKSTTIISELQTYFSASEKAITTLFQHLRSLKIYDSQFQKINKINTQFRAKQALTILMLFPFFDVKDISHFAHSPVFHIFKCGKDVFYDFLKSVHINWRKLSYSVTKQLINRVKKNSHNADKQPVRCLITDDTDLPKSGHCFEFPSRIYSHVTNSFNYGFKGLFLGYHYGKSFFGLDFSFHGEKGKDAQKPYGLTKKQSKRRYKNKNRKKSQSHKFV